MLLLEYLELHKIVGVNYGKKFRWALDTISGLNDRPYDDVHEPPRLYRRVIYLSQAVMPDRVKLS